MRDGRERSDAAPSVVRSILSTTHDRHLDLTALIDGLGDADLSWTPCVDAPALAGLVLHILDVEGHLAAIAVGEDDHWTGENGSHILDTGTLQDLRGAIEDVDVRVRTAFASLDDARLEALVLDGQPLVEASLEDLDHCALHHGQAQLARDMWEAAHPDAPRTLRALALGRATSRSSPRGTRTDHRRDPSGARVGRMRERPVNDQG